MPSRGTPFFFFLFFFFPSTPFSALIRRWPQAKAVVTVVDEVSAQLRRVPIFSVIVVVVTAAAADQRLATRLALQSAARSSAGGLSPRVLLLTIPHGPRPLQTLQSLALTLALALLKGDLAAAAGALPLLTSGEGDCCGLAAQDCPPPR